MASMDPKKAAEILGITGDPEDTDDYRQRVKTAFRVAATKLHPDRNRTDPNAQAKFVEAKQARDCLLEASKPKAQQAADVEEEEEEDIDEDSWEDEVYNWSESERRELYTSLILLMEQVRIQARQLELQAQELESQRKQVSSLKFEVRLLAGRLATNARPVPGKTVGSSQDIPPRKPVGSVQNIPVDGVRLGRRPSPKGGRGRPPVDVGLEWDPDPDEVDEVVRDGFFGDSRRR